MTSNNVEASRSRGIISADMDLKKDIRPEHSPYAGETCAVLFQDGKTLYIPRDLLNQVKNISRYLIAGLRLKVHFPHITSATGHVLLHFLVCGVYQCLRPQGDSLEKRRVSEFKTALDVYVAADSLQLPRLRDLARREISRVGDMLSLPSVISAIEELHLSFKTYPGVIAYVESRILSFDEEATPTVIDTMLSELEWPNTLSRTLLKSIVLLKSAELSRQQKIHEAEDQFFSGVAEDVAEAYMRRNRTSPAEQAMKEAEAKAEPTTKLQAEKRAIRVAEKGEVHREEAIAPCGGEVARSDDTLALWGNFQALREEQELRLLRAKQIKRCGNLKKKDKRRLNELLAKYQERSEDQVSRQVEAEAAKITIDDQAAPEPSCASPVMDAQEKTPPAPEDLKEEAEAEEAASTDRPGSRSSETWSFGATPDPESGRTSPKPAESPVPAEGNKEDFWNILLEREERKLGLADEL